MPTYKVTDPSTGRTVRLEGDSPPTEQELEQIFSSIGGAAGSQENKMNPLQYALAGYGGGMVMQGKGLQQKAAQLGEKIGLVSPETVEKITREGEEIRRDLDRLKSESNWATAGDIGSDISTGIVIPGGAQGKLARRMITGGLAGSLQSGARFTGKDESTTGNALAGGVFGSAAPAAMSGVAKVYNALAKKLTKPINVGGSIPTTLGEDIGSPALQRAETLLERVPMLGITGFRKEQHAAAEQAAKNYLGSFVAEGVDGSRGVLEKNRDAVSNLYGKFKSAMGGIERTPIQPSSTRESAIALRSRFSDVFNSIQDARTKSILSEIIGDTSPKTEKSILVDPFGRQVEKTINPNITFDDLWNLRSGLGDSLSVIKKKMQSGDVNKEAYSMFSKLYSAVTEDMDKFANSAGRPDVMEMFRTANDAYKNNVVKYNIIERAYDKAAGAIEETGKPFSPQRFHSALDGILKKEKYNNLFTATEKREMAGIANIMTIVKRAGQFMENPPTGNRMVDIAIGGGAVGSLLNPAAAQAAGTTAATASIMKFLTTTDAGKRLAMAASTIEPDSPSMKKIMGVVYRAARSGASSRNMIEEQHMGDNNEQY